MLKKTNETELKTLKTVEMEILSGGVSSSVGTCDLCHFTRREKARKELVDNTEKEQMRSKSMDLL